MKRRFLIIISVLILAMAVITIIAVSGRDAHVSRTETPVVSADAWTRVYSKYANSRGISILVDDTDTKAGQEAYLDDRSFLMIEKDLLREAFDCSVRVIGGDVLYIAKGAMTVQAVVGSCEMTVTGPDKEPQTVILQASPVMDGAKIYIPGEVMTEGIGYSYKWEPSTMAAVFTADNPSIENLPSYYNFANIGNIGYVRNQGNLGACWAFAAMAAMEYTLQPEEDWDFSEDHMLYNNAYELDDYGGDYLIAVSYLTSWHGPVREEDDPYNDGETDASLSAVKHVQEVQFLPSRDFAAIKKNLFKYGAVESSLYIELNEENTDLDPECYDPDTYSYIYTGDMDPNHEIVIIGWDDNYPKERFGGWADSDGAFICKNSWGSAFGDNGIFYVSYCDHVIGSVAVVYSGVESSSNYDHIRQMDEAGWVGLIGYGRNKAYMANVYEAESSESLKAVGFYATGENTSYKVYVCRNFKNAASLDVNTHVYAQGTFRNAGYYTVALDGDVELDAGQKYAIIVEITTPSSTKPVAIEIQTSQVEADMNGHESYLSSYGDQWECLQSKGNGNICLKAYTDDR